MTTIDLAGLEDDQRLGDELFARVWELLRRPARTAFEDDELIHAAHAARHHFGQLQPADHEQLAVSEWQISRVYCVLNRWEPARWHAERALANCVEGRLAGVVLGAAYEALARAARIEGDDASVHRYLRLGREVAERIADPEDRATLLLDLDAIDDWALNVR
jgi:hypothetical protein